MSATTEPPTFRRAMFLMTATSFLVPAAGILTAPILARALDADGRGELAAAQAPAALMLAIATLGLPDALTFHLAKRPGLTRSAIGWSVAVTTVLGTLCVLLTWSAVPFLSDGSADLATLILLAALLTVPALVVGVFRGAATGRQMWGAVAAERVATSVLRVAGLGGLWLSGELTVLTAVLVGALTPLLAGLAYWRLLLRVRAGDDEPPQDERTLRLLTSFGSRVWVGSVASMLLARVGQIFMTPLSSVEDLGLYSVASTISDVPLIVALAIQNALYGVNSRSSDAGQVTRTSRMTLLIGFTGCSALAVTLPFWLGPLFGSDFTGATVPTVMLLASAVLCIPGLMAASGVSAWGRPGLRSLGLGITLVVNCVAFVVLVPAFGVYGACWTSLLNNVVLTTFMVRAASRVMGVRARDFLLVTADDVRLLVREALGLLRRVRPSRRQEATGAAPEPAGVPVGSGEEDPRRP